jgi:hypothetical protein
LETDGVLAAVASKARGLGQAASPRVVSGVRDEPASLESQYEASTVFCRIRHGSPAQVNI